MADDGDGREIKSCANFSIENLMKMRSIHGDSHRQVGGGEAMIEQDYKEHGCEMRIHDVVQARD